MRILYAVHQFFPKHYTGTERFILNLAKQMHTMGHATKVLTYEPTETTGSGQLGSVFLKRYIFQGVPVLSSRHRIVPQKINFSIYDQEIEAMVRGLLNEEPFDILHVGHPMRNGSIIEVAKERNIPIVLTLTDFWLMCPKSIAVNNKGRLCCSPDEGRSCSEICYEDLPQEETTLRFKEAKDLIKSVDVICSPTHFLGDIFEDLFGIEVQVVRHGIQYSGIELSKRNEQRSNKVVFGYIGTVLPHKGVHIITRALSYISNENIKVKIYGNHFGEKSYYDSLKDMVKGDDRVEFLGEYNDEDLSDIVSRIDCMLVPSVWWENSPLTVLISLAHKVPVITTNIGGAAELIKDGVNGFNFEIGDPNDLAKKMKAIAENPLILDDIKSNIIRPPRIEEEAFIYENLYQSLNIK